jgi:uncharacterized membrane protein YhhN
VVEEGAARLGHQTGGALLLVAVVGNGAHPGARPWWIVALACCLVGDVLLMLPADRFVPGLVAFLACHVAFVVGLTRLAAPRSGALLVLGVVVVGLGLAVVAPRELRAVALLDRSLVPPVAVYMAVISTMVVAASRQGGGWGTLGAVCFYASDSMLAWERFVRPARWRPTAVMVTYHAALAGLLIALFH